MAKARNDAYSTAFIPLLSPVIPFMASPTPWELGGPLAHFDL